MGKAPSPGADQDRIRLRLRERALAVWPGLDRRALFRCGADARRIARYVSRRTKLTQEAVLSILLGSGVTEVERESWFG